MSELGKETLDDRTTELVQDLMQEAIDKRRQAIVYALARKMYQRFSAQEIQSSESQTDWEPIASLSQLRGLVGGRFQNLKDRWLAAGLPLRAHRGDREEEAEVNHDGWLELATWINKQGYETRLSDESEEGLFQVRQR